MKKQVRVIGIDDASFDKFRDKKITVIGTIFRGGEFMDGVVTTEVKVDGDDSTKKLSVMINKCRFKPQLQYILLDGINVAGFNVIDVQELSQITKLPVLTVIRRIPDRENIIRVLKKLGFDRKIKLIEKSGEVEKMGKIYVQLTNLSPERAKELLKITCTHSFIPEPIRVAHLIGAGLAKGESSGRA